MTRQIIWQIEAALANLQSHARCASCDRDDLLYRRGSYGFRVVCIPLLA